MTRIDSTRRGTARRVGHCSHTRSDRRRHASTFTLITVVYWIAQGSTLASAAPLFCVSGWDISVVVHGRLRISARAD
ncbi:hypothetical protein PLICRDRAFT_54465 [Plicaturopsis crispa FD-325 SS-3]|nr:hypothetical protein PLICRDRAFT_54465 [Plicaturopsis crispa FD-325 SS-3]